MLVSIISESLWSSANCSSLVVAMVIRGVWASPEQVRQTGGVCRRCWEGVWRPEGEGCQGGRGRPLCWSVLNKDKLKASVGRDRVRLGGPAADLTRGVGRDVIGSYSLCQAQPDTYMITLAGAGRRGGRGGGRRSCRRPGVLTDLTTERGGAQPAVEEINASVLARLWFATEPNQSPVKGSDADQNWSA